MEWMWWLGGALVLGVVEVLTVGLVFLMFAGGALAGMVLALLGAPGWVQVVAFALVSVALLFLARPAAKNWLLRATPETRTNAEALIGTTARVVLEVSDTGGRVKVVGEVWSARSANPDEVFPVDQDVMITGINGAIALVSRLEQ